MPEQRNARHREGVSGVTGAMASRTPRHRGHVHDQPRRRHDQANRHVKRLEPETKGRSAKKNDTVKPRETSRNGSNRDDAGVASPRTKAEDLYRAPGTTLDHARERNRGPPWSVTVCVPGVAIQDRWSHEMDG